MSLRRAALGSNVFAWLVLGCSSAGSHPSFMLGECAGVTCGDGILGGPAVVGGGANAPRGDAGVVGGAAAVGGLGAGAIASQGNCSSDFGVTLCLSTAACPGVTLDANQFPSCGFRAGTSSLSVICVCNGSELCPIGAVATCEELPTLLSQQSITGVCNQAATTGACTELRGGFGTSSGGVSTCDRNCAATCDNAPTCVKACGC